MRITPARARYLNWSLTSRLLAIAMILSAMKTGIAQGPPGDIAELFFDIRPGPLDERQIAGIPPAVKSETLTWQRAYALALVKSRGGTRLENLAPDALSARAKDLDVDNFTRFRKDFTSDKAFRDPSADLLNLQARVLDIENARRKATYLEKMAALLRELLQGESGGLTQYDLDQFDSMLQKSRLELSHKIADFRDRLDATKLALGLSPHAPVTVDLAPLVSFRETFERFDRWYANPNRGLDSLGELAARLAPIGDVSIEGHAVLEEIQKAPDRLEEVLSLATRIALKNQGEGKEFDDIELRVRRRIRGLSEKRVAYHREQEMTVLAARELSHAFEQVVAPPVGPSGVGPQRRGPTLVRIAGNIRRISENRERLLSLWTSFCAERLALYRDLGILPYEDWASFYGQFTAQPGERVPAPPQRSAPSIEPALPLEPTSPPPTPDPKREDD
ncbi:hypothetical protein V5E97_19015 [Singulisphaera sp. Ch08]|uniref:TolC family protein n=1 Tax=Singulisphaera sp. Ch08 TaxID=3120278 RepID=A0AAU7CSW0_9BACT